MSVGVLCISTPSGNAPPWQKCSSFSWNQKFQWSNGQFHDIPCLTRDSVFIGQFHYSARDQENHRALNRRDVLKGNNLNTRCNSNRCKSMTNTFTVQIDLPGPGAKRRDGSGTPNDHTRIPLFWSGNRSRGYCSSAVLWEIHLYLYTQMTTVLQCSQRRT